MYWKQHGQLFQWWLKCCSETERVCARGGWWGSQVWVTEMLLPSSPSVLECLCNFTSICAPFSLSTPWYVSAQFTHPLQQTLLPTNGLVIQCLDELKNHSLNKGPRQPESTTLLSPLHHFLPASHSSLSLYLRCSTHCLCTYDTFTKPSWHS